MGDVMLDSGKYKDGIDKFTIGIEFLNKLEKEKTLFRFGSPDSVSIHRSDFYSQRAFAFCQLKEYKKGIADLTQAIRYRPTYSLLYTNRAQAYELIGKKDLA